MRTPNTRLPALAYFLGGWKLRQMNDGGKNGHAQSPLVSWVDPLGLG